MGRHTEGQFLLHTIFIIDFNGMAGSVACIANDTPVSCLVHKIAVYKLLVLFLRHIPQSAIRLAAFLHLQRELDGGRHIERQGSDRGKQESSQDNCQQCSQIAYLILLEIAFG